MKIRITKWLGLTAAIILGMSGLDSCVKSRGGLETDFSNISDFVVFQYGGLVNFGSSVISAGPADPDTVTITTIVTLASKNVASSPVTVTIGLDDSKRTNYNTANGTSLEALPSNAYKFVTPTVTVPAGQNYATVTIEVYARNVDPSISYMFPVTILDAGGKALSGNLNTIYYHIIGNPIAGKYVWNFTRWSSPDSTTAPDGNSFTNHSTLFLPLNSTSIEVKSGYFIGPRYQISFTNTAGVLSNFKVKFNPDDADALVAGGVTVITPPTFLIANGVTKHFRIYYTTLTRAVIDEYYP